MTEETTEWDDSRCWFCKKRPSVPDAKHEVDLYRVLHRKSTYVVVAIEYKQQYETTKTWVPRCSSCKRIHDRVGLFFGAAWLILGTVAMFYSFTLPQNQSDSLFVTIVGGGLSIIMTYFMCAVAVGGVYLFTSMFWKSEEYAAEHPRVLELKKAKWEIGDKPPYKWSGPDTE